MSSESKITCRYEAGNTLHTLSWDGVGKYAEYNRTNSTMPRDSVHSFIPVELLVDLITKGVKTELKRRVDQMPLMELLKIRVVASEQRDDAKAKD